MPLLLRQLSEHAVVNKFGRSLPRQHASARPGSRSPGTTACSAQAFSRSPAGDFVYREHDGIEASWQLLDWTKLTIDETPHRWSALLEEDAAQPFDLAKPALVRFLAIELPQGHCHLLMTYPKVLLDEDAVFRLLCAWLGALEGALPLDAEEPSRPFEESPTIVGWWSERLAEAAEPRMLRVYPRRTLDWPTGARSESHLTMDREMSVAFENLCRQLGVSGSGMHSSHFALW